MKPTRTENNKPSQSGVIRKGKLSQEEIKKTAEELTRLQKNATFLGKCMGVTTDEAINNIKKTAKELTKIPEIIQEVEAPAIEPVQKGDYKAFANSIKSKLQTNNDTVSLESKFIKSLFPQVKCAGDVVKNLKRYYGLSYRRIDNGRNDTYVFFIEPTREQLLVENKRLTDKNNEYVRKSLKRDKIYRNDYNTLTHMLTSAETKVIQLEKVIDSRYKEYCERYNGYYAEKQKLTEENTQLKSDLSLFKRTSYVLFAFAIVSVITTILK